MAQEDHPYVALDDKATEEVQFGLPLRAESDTHMGEKLQGRLCAALLLGSCCAASVCALNGCSCCVLTPGGLPISRQDRRRQP